MDNNQTEFEHGVRDDLPHDGSLTSKVSGGIPFVRAEVLDLSPRPPADIRMNIAVAGPRNQSEPSLGSGHGKRRLILSVGCLLVLGTGSVFGRDYWLVGRFHVSTDDAYIQADTITIAPKVSGYLAQVLVGDNEPVHAGQALARIDTGDFKVALDQANADVSAAAAAIASKQAAISAQQSNERSARATIVVDRSNQIFAAQESRRYAYLATTGFGSRQNAQHTASLTAASVAGIQRDEAALASSAAQVSVQRAELAQAQAALAHNQATQAQAKLNLGYATIFSPADGTVGNRTLRVGQYVQIGTELMSIVPAAATYVVANFKETQLTDVRRGQPVEIQVDMFPSRTYRGWVDTLAPASGQTFALLPPDNATGNFTKVVQRIPVRITLDPRNTGLEDLRPGMSVTPVIDTKPRIQARARKDAAS